MTRLNGEINRVLQSAEMRAALAERGVEGGGGSAASFAAMLESERALWARAVRESGATVD